MALTNEGIVRRCPKITRLGDSMARTTFTEKMRRRREARAFQHVLDNASPNLRAELIAIAQRRNVPR